MMKKKKAKTDFSIRNFLLISVLLLNVFSALAQQNTYKCKREITNVTGEWHRIWLPEDVLDKTKNCLSDLRIVALNAEGETIEIPYLLENCGEKEAMENFQMNIIDKNKKNARMFYVLETPTLMTINQIELNFRQSNFDWLVKLEGSQDYYSWQTILHSQRVVSIKNETEDYRFSTLHFPDSRYYYYRISILSFRRPDLLEAQTRYASFQSDEKIYPAELKSSYEKEYGLKQSKLTIKLAHKQKVASMKIYTSRPIDFVRRINMSTITDSIETAQGTQYVSAQLGQKYLSSLEKGEIPFSGQAMQNIHITIDNEDNQPLKIDSVKIMVYKQSITVRFTESGQYYMLYGNNDAQKPQYDLVNFTHKIPKDLGEASLGQETENTKENAISLKTDAKIYWLWAIIGIIILALAAFSLKMLKN